jgi:hypothetical protein
MKNLNSVINDFAAGSSLRVRRTVIRVPNGSAIQAAVFTVKAAEAGPDNPDIILKTITTVDQSGIGQVENQGGAGTCHLRFELTEADTILLTPNRPYYYSIDVCLDRGVATTVEKGKITASLPVPGQNGDANPYQEQQNGNGVWQAARDARRALEERACELMKLSADARNSGDIKAMSGADAELADLRQQYKRHSVAERAACIAHTCALNESLPAQLQAAQLEQWELETEYDTLLKTQDRERVELAGKLDEAKARVFHIETQLTANSRTFSEAEAGFHAAIQRVLSSGPFT